MTAKKAFSDQERDLLLKTHMVGPAVIQRLEEIGLGSFTSLQQADVSTVVDMISGHLGTTCWENNPHARMAIANAIKAAKDL